MTEHRPARREPVLECHDPLLPTMLTAGGCVAASAVCLFAIFSGFKGPIASVGGWTFNLWLVAAFTGAISVALSALSFVRSFTVRCDSIGMVSRASGRRWKDLRVGTMPWPEIRSLHERVEDGILEIHAAAGGVFEIPMRVTNYAVLRQHLENVVQIYGEARAKTG